jgi:Arc/MetJ family transcription regulator
VHAIRRLRTFGDPVQSAFVIQMQADFFASRDWIEVTDTFNATTVTRIAFVSDYNVVKRAFFRAAT